MFFIPWSRGYPWRYPPQLYALQVRKQSFSRRKLQRLSPQKCGDRGGPGGDTSCCLPGRGQGQDCHHKTLSSGGCGSLHRVSVGTDRTSSGFLGGSPQGCRVHSGMTQAGKARAGLNLRQWDRGARHQGQPLGEAWGGHPSNLLGPMELRPVRTCATSLRVRLQASLRTRTPHISLAQWPVGFSFPLWHRRGGTGWRSDIR